MHAVLTNRICRMCARTPRYAPRAAEMASSSSSVMPAGAGAGAGAERRPGPAAPVRPLRRCSSISMRLEHFRQLRLELLQGRG